MRLAILVFVAFLAQQPAPVPEGGRSIPPCRGSQCRGENGYETDGPSWCQNYSTKEWKANCSCKTPCGSHHSVDCMTWCRTPRCRCEHGCHT